jgi:hypothetical protein
VEAQPQLNTLLELKLYIFTNAYWNDTAGLTDDNFWDIKGGVIRERGSSGLWFYPAIVGIPSPIPSLRRG